MSNEIEVVSNNSLAKPEQNLLYFLQKFDEYSLQGITEVCQDYDNETLSGIVFFLERLKRRSFLYQWTVIATKAFRLKAEAEDRKEPAYLHKNLSRIFPMYSASAVFKKYRGWVYFYQDANTTRKAKWNGQSYIFEELEFGAEAWFFKAVDGAKTPEVAKERLRMAEKKYLEAKAQGKSYNSQDFSNDLKFEKNKKGIIPPLSKYSNMTSSMVHELDKYLEDFNYGSDYQNIFKDIRSDLDFLSKECAYLKGKISLEELEDSRNKSRISRTDVSKIDLAGILDPDLSVEDDT